VAADNAFHRAYQNFLKARAREDVLLDAAPDVALPNEPNLAVETEPTPLPNEPNLAVEPAITGSNVKTSDASPAMASSPARPRQARPASERPAPNGTAPVEFSQSADISLPNGPNFEPIPIGTP
jgi:hypothetical protein